MASHPATKAPLANSVTAGRWRRVVLAALVTLCLSVFAGLLFARADNKNEPTLLLRGEATAANLVEGTSASATQILTTGDRAKAINASLPFSTAPIEAAKPFKIDTAALEYSPALLCLASAVYHEAGFEPLLGRRGVAQVVLNRVRHPAFPKSICGVVFQGAGSPVCQFSFACDGSRSRAPPVQAWRESVGVAAAALAGHVEPSVGTATHYHADYVAPRWAPQLSKITQVATHIFYRWPGDWGRGLAFRGRYVGEQGAPLQHVKLPAAELAAIEAVETGKVRAMGVLEINDGEVSSLVVDGTGRGTKHPLQATDIPFARWNGKPITVTLIARLVEQQLLAWDAPLEQLLPELATTMRPEYRTVTLIELLSNPSALPNRTDSDFIRGFHKDDRPLPEQRLAYLQRALTVAPPEPAEKAIHSDTAFLAAAAAAERITGRSFEELVREMVFRPLKMSSVQRGTSKERQSLLDEGRKLFPAAESTDPAMWGPAGAIPMNLADFGRFLSDQMYGQRGKGKLLKTASYKLIHTSARGAKCTKSRWGWTLLQDQSARQFVHIAADGSTGTAVIMAPASLDAVIITTETHGNNAAQVIDSAVTAVRKAWLRRSSERRVEVVRQRSRLSECAYVSF